MYLVQQPPALQQKVNLSWHALINCHEIMFIKIGYIEHPHSHNSWMYLGGVVNLFKLCFINAHKSSKGFKCGDWACH